MNKLAKQKESRWGSVFAAIDLVSICWVALFGSLFTNAVVPTSASDSIAPVTSWVDYFVCVGILF